MKTLAQHKRAYFDYTISQTYECGIVLEGWEVKAILANKISINEAYVKIINDEIVLIGASITPCGNHNAFTNLDSTRTRKLLLHKHEINKLIGKVQISGFTLIPVKVYYKNKRIKVEIALGKGKKLYDKRESTKIREVNRQLARISK